MSDSNPRSGDWNNKTAGVLVGGGLGVLLLLMVLLIATGHSNIAILIAVILAVATVIAAIKAGQRERDH